VTTLVNLDEFDFSQANARQILHEQLMHYNAVAKDAMNALRAVLTPEQMTLVYAVCDAKDRGGQCVGANKALRAERLAAHQQVVLAQQEAAAAKRKLGQVLHQTGQERKALRAEVFMARQDTKRVRGDVVKGAAFDYQPVTKPQVGRVLPRTTEEAQQVERVARRVEELLKKHGGSATRADIAAPLASDEAYLTRAITHLVQNGRVRKLGNTLTLTGKRAGP